MNVLLFTLSQLSGQLVTGDQVSCNTDENQNLFKQFSLCSFASYITIALDVLR